ncbi:MAG TPA: protein kinase [Chloroflexia bacterium]|nr:protein kinase [Chloroflexia bacterium]
MVNLQGATLGGRYSVIRPVGAGAMADVYEARDMTLKRRVAIKLLKESLAEDSNAVERIRREALAASRFYHKNLVQIYDLGEYDERPYIVMELVEGLNLRELYLQYQPAPIEWAVNITLQLLAGLEHIHQSGRRHRDIKPRNILVGADGILKLIDYSIIKGQADPDLTMMGTVFGSAGYISPEQARGEPAENASDLYSVGIVLYEMLAGSPPFQGTRDELMRQHSNPTLLPPSLRTYRPDVPEALENIIMKAIAKKLTDRFQSTRELTVALEAFVAGNLRDSAGRADRHSYPHSQPISMGQAHDPSNHSSHSTASLPYGVPSQVASVTSGASAAPGRGHNGRAQHAPPPGYTTTTSIFDHRYALVRLIHQGEYTEVWLASDMGPLPAGAAHQPRAVTGTYPYVALKVLREELVTNKIAVSIFRREINVTSTLWTRTRQPDGQAALYSKTYIAPLLHVGEFQARPYMVMEFIADDHSAGLRRANAGHVWGFHRCYLVAEALTRALEWLHGAGWAHGGLSMEDILVSVGSNSPRNATLTVKLIDFGLAHEIEGGKPKRVQPGKESFVAQTQEEGKQHLLPYMAPERFSGSTPGNLPSVAADIYAVGAILHTLFIRESSARQQEAAGAIGQLPVHYPSLYEIPYPPHTQFISIIEKCLDPAPDKRYKSATELLKVLHNYKDFTQQNTEPLAALPPPFTIMRGKTNIDFGSVSSEWSPRTQTFVIEANSDQPGTIKYESDDAKRWLDIDTLSFASDGNTTVTVTVDPAKLPHPGDHTTRILVATETPHHSVRLPVRVRLLSGLDLILLIDTIGTEEMIDARRSIAKELIFEVEDKVTHRGGLRVAVIAYWCRTPGSGQRPLRVHNFNDSAPAIEMLGKLAPDLGRSYPLESSLDEALAEAGKLGWSAHAWHALVAIAGRPPYPPPGQAQYPHQVESPLAVNWKDGLRKLKSRQALFNTVISCPIYWPDGAAITAPSYAEKYRDVCFQAFDSWTPIDNIYPSVLARQIEEHMKKES